MPITHAGEDLAMKQALGTGTGSSTSSMGTIRLHTADPGPTGGTAGLIESGFAATSTNTTQLNGGYPLTAWTYNSSPSGTPVQNTHTISFTRNAGESTVTVTHISIMKGTNYVWYASIGTVTWAAGQTIEFAAGSIKLDLSN
jgi:hypothetical protein